MHRDLNDFELLYLIKNNCMHSILVMLEKYNPLVWKNVFKYSNQYTPKGVEQDDLYQEGRIALFASIYAYKNFIHVPFYAFTNLCINRKMGGYLRKFNSETSKLFYNALSLDMTVTEDQNLYLHEMVADDVNEMSAFVRYAKNLNSLAIEEKDLNDFEKIVLILRVYGYSYNEISRLLYCPTKKVDNTLQKIKRIRI